LQLSVLVHVTMGGVDGIRFIKILHYEELDSPYRY